MSSVDAQLLSSLTFDPSIASSGINPLTQPGHLAGRIGTRIAGRLTNHLAVQGQMLANGALPWLRFEKCHRVDSTLPSTPPQLAPLADPRWWPGAYAALGIVDALGLKPVSYRCENNGHMFVNLTALYGGSLGPKSLRGMRGHTDAACFPFPHEFKLGLSRISPSPDFLFLIGYRNPDAVSTTVVPVSRLLSKLPAWAVDELAEPKFNIKNQDTFRITCLAVNRPLLSYHPQYGPYFRFSHSHVATDAIAHPKAQQALDLIHNTLPSLREEVCVEPGDVLVINNRIAIHGRNPVGGSPGGDSRWLIRGYANRPTTSGIHCDPNAPHLLCP